MKPVYRPGAVAIVLAVITWALIGVVIWQLRTPAEVILFDPGGPIAARAAMVRNGEPATIVGLCGSACTMHLLTGCVTPGAMLVFHGPQTDDPRLFEHYSQVMARHYPPALADWFMAVGRFGEWQMTGAEAIRLGARAC